MEANSFKKRFSIFEIAMMNLRHNALMSVAVAGVLCLLTPLFIGTAHLDVLSSAMPLEMFVSLVGMILLTPVFQPEQNREIRDLISSKPFSIIKVYWVRIVYAILLSVLFVGLFAVYMKGQNSEITLALVLGTIADAVFLGAIGMLASSMTDHTIMGYMAGLCYYALNIGMGAKLGCFYLFSMTVGQYAPKVWLIAASFVMIAMSLVYQKIGRL